MSDGQTDDLTAGGVAVESNGSVANTPHPPVAGGDGAHPRRWRRGVASWRAILFAPVGDGQTRRRGSDAFRVGAAVLAVLLCWLFTRANSNAEHDIASTLASPPQGLRWLITVIWWVASFGVIALIAVLALANRQ